MKFISLDISSIKGERKASYASKKKISLLGKIISIKDDSSELSIAMLISLFK